MPRERSSSVTRTSLPVAAMVLKAFPACFMINWFCWFILLLILFLNLVYGLSKKKVCHDSMAHPLLVVCSARALSNGCKSRVSPNSGNYIAKGKGVHREVKSERSRRQTSDLTDRNFIQGIRPWVRLLYKPKPYSYSERSV